MNTSEYKVAEGLDRKNYAEKMIKAMEENSMSIVAARQCLNRLPRKGYEYGYTEDVYTTCYKCHKKLWEYCKANGYIDDIDYDEFTNHGMIHFKLRQ